MISSYFKIALINILRHRIFAAINILGLAIGLACCIVIVLYVRYELSFDKHYSNAARIVRVDQVAGDAANFRTPGLLANALVNEVQGVEEAGRFINVETVLSFENSTFNELEFAYADAQFLQIFDFQWLQGSAQQALNDPASIVLTQALASKYFGSEDPLGKVLRMGDYSVRVTGVIADLPANTHLRFSALASMDLFVEGLRTIGFDLDVWNRWFSSTYALLDEGTQIASVENQLPALVAKHMQPGITLNVLPLADIYMHARAQMELSPVGSMPRVLIFSAIALCILVIAVINFINLSTARASWRALEVGLRKSIGASRVQIIMQFLGEAVLQVVCAMVLGLMLVELLLPWVNAVTGKMLAVDIWTNPGAMAGLLALTLGMGLLAGFYPAFYLSAFRPVAVLKGQITRGPRASVLRSLLVVMQFSISIAMIIAASVIYLQIQYVREVDMGFTYEQVVVLDVQNAEIFNANRQWDALRAQLNNHPGVIDSTHSVSTPVRHGAKTGASIYREDNGAMISSQGRMTLESVEPAYLETYGLKLLAGQWFSASLQSDRLVTFPPGYEGTPRGSLVLNEEAARLLGWSAAEAVGQVLGVGTTNRGVVKGVVSNTMASTRQSYRPRAYYVPQEFDYPFGATIAVRIVGKNVPQTLDHIDATWKAFFPDNPVQRYFLEDEIEALYQQERQQMQLSVLSAMVAVLIACFGLYALAAFNAEHRSKEIGVRKVMGGSVWSIVLLLTNDFSKLVLIANLIAWPVAYLAMSSWLENFAYRIDLTPLIFIGSGLIALCVAWVTVGGTAAKAASAKPVVALRYE